MASVRNFIRYKEQKFLHSHSLLVSVQIRKKVVCQYAKPDRWILSFCPHKSFLMLSSQPVKKNQWHIKLFTRKYKCKRKSNTFHSKRISIEIQILRSNKNIYKKQQNQHAPKLKRAAMMYQSNLLILRAGTCIEYEIHRCFDPLLVNHLPQTGASTLA